jgi:hypothetical protein
MKIQFKVFETKHKLEFLSAHWDRLVNTEGWQIFKVGTCHGQWRATKDNYEILSVINNEPGNGHFDDVLQWFYESCKRDKKNLKILELWNADLMKHLIDKREFTYADGDNVIKSYKKMN